MTTCDPVKPCQRASAFGDLRQATDRPDMDLRGGRNADLLEVDLDRPASRSAEMQLVFIVIALSAGVASAFQSGTNQTLQKALNAPLWAAAIVTVVTAVSSIAVVLASGERLPAGNAAATAPWWSWAGGLLGVGFVLGTVFAAPKLGAGLFMASIVTAEVLTGLVLDHFGLLGFEVHQAGWGRLIGGALMIIGLSLIARF